MIKEALQAKINSRTKPLGSLGKLESLALRIGTIQNSLTPELKNPAIIVFAADHGIADEGVSPCPKEITWQMVMNFVNGGAGINVFSSQHNIRLSVVDAGVDYDFSPEMNVINRKLARGTNNMLHSPAMSVEMCQKAMQIGAELVRDEFKNGCNIIGFGEMGIGNSSAASLLLHKYTELPLKECVGRGAGHNEEGLRHKREVLRKVIEKHNPQTPLEILATFGGLEIAMICGGVIEAKKLGMVIVADGFITSSAFLAAYNIQPDIIDNVIFSHLSQEYGHKKMVEAMGGDPLLHLDLRLGEGTGVAIVYPIIESAVTFLNKMASFEEAAVFRVDK